VSGPAGSSIVSSPPRHRSPAGHAAAEEASASAAVGVRSQDASPSQQSPTGDRPFVTPRRSRPATSPPRTCAAATSPLDRCRSAGTFARNVPPPRVTPTPSSAANDRRQSVSRTGRRSSITGSTRASVTAPSVATGTPSRSTSVAKSTPSKPSIPDPEVRVDEIACALSLLGRI
jgi:hypothetical protein